MSGHRQGDGPSRQQSFQPSQRQGGDASQDSEGGHRPQQERPEDRRQPQPPHPRNQTGGLDGDADDDRTRGERGR